jgi:4-hydroxyphenylpyruvate dioxygenase
LRKHGDGVKVAALWVEDATSAYQEKNNETWCSFFMEPRIEKDDLEK